MNYNDVKKLDEKTLQKLTDGLGPSDECLCSLLAPPEDGGGFGASLRKVFAWPGKKRGPAARGQTEVNIPLTFSKGGKGVFTTKEVVKRSSYCGKCGCDQENIVLKHSYANIRITSPDVSSICPCPTDCLPDREKLMNNIKVTIEHLRIIEPYAHRSDSLPNNSQNVNEQSDDVSQGSDGVSVDVSEAKDMIAD